MRQIILDTETTGLTVEDGHRIIEVGCLEIVDRRVTGRSLHLYLNPERSIDAGALAVHGLTEERLKDEPRFREVVDELLSFVADAQVLIHNASFDIGFLDAELRASGRPGFATHVHSVVDTLAMARELHPGKRNSLDALCERYGVSNAHRTLHGALLDAELLADVYLQMTRGQESLEIAEIATSAGPVGTGAVSNWPPTGLRVLAASAVEAAEHESYLGELEAENRRVPLWTTLAATEHGHSA